MPKMQLAHLSDLHLLSLNGARLLDFANKRWIGGLNLLTNRGRHYHTEVFAAMVEDLNRQAPDHILVTGDITNLAFDEEFRFAREHFDRLVLGPGHITVLPGNHDAYVAEGSRHFAHHFGDFYASDDEFRWDDDDAWPAVRVRDGVAIIGLSTSLKTPWFTAYGVVGEKQLQRLASVLKDPRLSGLFRLVAIHHPPAGPRARSRVRGLRDRNALAAVIADAGADLIVHGHEHQHIREVLAGPNADVPVHGIQSGTYEAGNDARRARYRVYDIREGRTVSDRIRLWDPERREFTSPTAPESAAAAV